MLTLQTGPSPPNRTELVGELLLVPSSQDVPDKDGAPGQHDGTGFRKSTNTLGVPVDGWSHLHIFTLRGHCHCPGCLNCSPLKVIQTNEQINKKTPKTLRIFSVTDTQNTTRGHTRVHNGDSHNARLHVVCSGTSTGCWHRTRWSLCFSELRALGAEPSSPASEHQAGSPTKFKCKKTKHSALWPSD